MKRLQLITQQLRKRSSNPQFIPSGIDFLNMSSFITPQQNFIRLKVRQLVDKHLIPNISSYVQSAQFPQFLLIKFSQLDISKYFVPAPYGEPLSSVAQGMILAEIARGDGGFGTFFMIQIALIGNTVNSLGSEQQKKEYLPGILRLSKIGGWALTEDKIGSDAANIETCVEVTENGLVMNGNKRWIGSGNRDFVIVWAKNKQTNKVQGYILDNKWKGISAQKIQNKLAVRTIQNFHLKFENVPIPQSAKLPKANSFATGPNPMLKHSRVFACWVAAGVCLGVYETVIKYATTREQFGRLIAQFQLVQQKIVKIMSNLQGVLLCCWRISKLLDEGNLSIGQIAMVKAYVTERGREICKWGREILGGNGIIHDNYVMKAYMDVEALYTYEGSYDINTLIAGRELTGISAFK